MGKVIVIHQPDFLPYIGFFHRLLKADTFVVLDNVQFLRGSKRWHNRDKIKTSNGEKWLTVSVNKTKRKTMINEITLANSSNWRMRHLNLINTNYKEARYFEQVFPYIKKLYEYECERLVDFNLKAIEILFDLFDINIEKVLSSTLNANGKSNELLANIVKEVNGDVYLSGLGAKDYFEADPFNSLGISVIWQDFTHPIYPQLHGEFVPYLSSIDLLLNCGIDRSRKILRDI